MIKDLQCDICKKDIKIDNMKIMILCKKCSEIIKQLIKRIKDKEKK